MNEPYSSKMPFEHFQNKISNHDEQGHREFSPGEKQEAAHATDDVIESNASILVVDDSKAVRLAMVLQLNALGYANVQEAQDGRAALDLLRTHSFDLMLLDIEMPRLDGFGVLEALKGESRRSKLPIIVTSGVGEVDAVVRCIQLGADDFLHKPVNAVLLNARVAASLERKRLHDLQGLRLRELLQQKRFLETEQAKSKYLLSNILPEAIAVRLMAGEEDIAERHPSVTVLFADVVNFTRLASHTNPIELVAHLNDVFTRFDQLVDAYRVEKIKTIGDCYMAVGGLPFPRPHHAEIVASMALDMLRAIEDVNIERGIDLDLRIGMDSGPVVAGIIGRKKFAYDLWGHTVNIASRLESTGKPGRIQVSQATHDLLVEKFSLSLGRMVDCKGIGEIQTYFLNKRNLQ